MRVCDGTNAAYRAINQAPERFRPHRLCTPDREEVGPTGRRATSLSDGRDPKSHQPSLARLAKMAPTGTVDPFGGGAAALAHSPKGR